MSKSKGPYLDYNEWFSNFNSEIAKVIDRTASIDKTQFFKLFKIIDRQDAIKRYKWYNLPKGLTADIIERVLYLRGQGMMYKLKDKFYFLPYTMASSKGTGIDVYGRYNQATPVSMGATEDEDGEPLIVGKAYDISYDIELEDVSEKEQYNKCVLLHDYAPSNGYYNEPRANLQNVIINFEAELFPQMQTAMIVKSGIRAMRVEDETESGQVASANKLMKNASIKGEPLIPVVGKREFQDLSGSSNTAEPEAFMSALQSLENFRKKCLGIETDGLLQKNQHVLTGEHEMNATSSKTQMDDGLYQRQLFCIIAESIWHLGMWCEPNESDDMTQESMYREEQMDDVGGGEDATNVE